MSDTENKQKVNNTPGEQLKEVQQPVLPTQVNTYATLMETSGEEYESWYYFIKYQGNEEALKHLEEQLKQVEWYIDGDLCTFDLESEFLVSEQTAKEMTKIDMNPTSFHRKFDGKLQLIDLGFKDKDSDEKKMKRAYKVLGYGKIDEFIDKEDVDPEDLVSNSEESSKDESDSTNDDSESEDNSSSESSSESSEEEKPLKKPKGIPKALKNSNLPRFAKAKRHSRK